MNMKHRQTSAFTLIELLVVIAIIAILAGLLLPALAGVNEHARKVKAKTQMKNLQTAIAMYQSDYSILPFGYSATDRLLSDTEYDILIRTLQNVAPNENPRKKRYLDIDTDQGPGVMEDPWENDRYMVALDLNYDKQIDADTTNGPYKIVYDSVAIWALGKDQSNDLGKKEDGDINSWED